MTFRFYPEGCMTVVVKDNSAFTLSDAAASNWTRPVNIKKTFEDLPLNVMKETSNLREGKKESRYYWELPYGEECEILEFLKDHYRGFGLHGFHVGMVTFYGTYTTNEVNEPYLIVTAKLPRHIIEGICNCIRAEYMETTR